MRNVLKKFYIKAITSCLLLAGVIIPSCGWADMPMHYQQDSEITIAARAFDRFDCKKYLGRNLIAKGYQPIQIIVKNHTNKPVFFSPDSMNLPLVQVEEVIASAETSTVGRSTSYGVASYFVSDLFIIPAVVDGVKSSKANSVLGADYRYKVAKEQTIHPKSTMNKVIFVQRGQCPRLIKMCLVAQGSHQIYEQEVAVRGSAYQVRMGRA